MLAPTFGGYLAVYLGWSSVFMVLTAIAVIILLIVIRYLPESHKADHSHVLHPIPIIRNYLSILKEPQFYTYAVSGATAFAGLFVYLAASPTIFMEIFGVTEQIYGWIFAFIAMGLVGMSQLNVLLIKKYSNEQILLASLIILTLTSLVFFICALNGWYNVYSIILTMFVFLSCIGLSNPNSAALAMAPFGSKAGSAAAMLGFLQMAIGAIASVCVGIMNAQKLLPLSTIFISTTTLALIILILGSRNIVKKVEVNLNSTDTPVAH